MRYYEPDLVDIDDDIGDELAESDMPIVSCGYCDQEGHTARSCPERDDDSLFEIEEEE